uniref:Putative nonspecific lipid-transfer protein n=1 Tax=Trypanosoma congolense (strain IL3000) TaxID=1068625 RepID=G0URE4_TRYCI|nr:putative nonspecific lipid-transfer protein [Trypanosoma congolense IL3000]
MSSRSIRIVGVGRTAVGRLHRSATDLAIAALDSALGDANMKRTDLEALVALPALSSPQFMPAHRLATVAGLVPTPGRFLLRTVDTGGAGPLTALGTAVDLVRNGYAHTVAVVASDAILSMDSAVFAERSNASVRGSGLPEPCIPHEYDLYARWHMQRYGLKREQLAMASVLMSKMAERHPDAMCRRALSLDHVLQSRPVAPVTSLLECARRADGAVALIVSSESHYTQHFAVDQRQQALGGSKPIILSVAEASGPLFPPPLDQGVSPDVFSCGRAVREALQRAHLSTNDIQFFGLYDCFPICLIRALEAVGLCAEGEGGDYIESVYDEMLQADGILSPAKFPVNTHGGLQCFGAPWEVPAMYNVTEAIAQLSGAAGDRQITPVPRRALVYGNGGIFSASSVAILGSDI